MTTPDQTPANPPEHLTNPADATLKQTTSDPASTADPTSADSKHQTVTPAVAEVQPVTAETATGGAAEDGTENADALLPAKPESGVPGPAAESAEPNPKPQGDSPAVQPQLPTQSAAEATAPATEPTLEAPPAADPQAQQQGETPAAQPKVAIDPRKARIAAALAARQAKFAAKRRRSKSLSMTGSSGAQASADEAIPLDTEGCLPGWGFPRADKEGLVYEALAEKLSVLVNRTITSAELRACGLRAVKEVGGMRRQFSLWWPGVMSDDQLPIHCTPSYHVGAVKLLEIPACREKLGIKESEIVKISQTAAAAMAPTTDHNTRKKRALEAVVAAAATDPAAAALAAQLSPKRHKQLSSSGYAAAVVPTAAAAAAGAQHVGLGAVAAAAAGQASRKRRSVADVNNQQRSGGGSGSSIEQVLQSVDAADAQLSEALDLVDLFQSWPTEVIASLPGSAVLSDGLDQQTLDLLRSEAQTYQKGLTTDRVIFEQMAARYEAKAAAAAAAGAGSSAVDAAAAYREPLFAFMTTLEACVADALAFLTQGNQKQLLDKIRALLDIKGLVDLNLELTHQLEALQGGDLQADIKGLPGTGLAADGSYLREADSADEQRLSLLLEQQKQQRQQRLRQQQQLREQQTLDDLQQDSEDPDLAGQQQNRYDLVVAAATELANASQQQQQQQQQQPSSGLDAGRQGSGGNLGGQGSGGLNTAGSGGGTVMTFLQQFMKNAPAS